MRITKQYAGVAAIVLTAPVASTLGAITITQSGAAAPTYSTTLNFDEVGGPTGVTATDAWLGSHGVTSLMAGSGGGSVGDFSGTFPWLPANNAYHGPAGVFMDFDSDLSEFSAQVWDNSGPGGPFGGGMGVSVWNDGAEVAFMFFNDPAWGGVGDSWFNITTSDGDTFDSVRILGFGFPLSDTYMDNASWNVVPAPGALALFGLGLARGRRRRNG